MSRIAKVFSERIVHHLDVLPMLAGKLLKKSINSVRINDYTL